jgi:hypothetical protein
LVAPAEKRSASTASYSAQNLARFSGKPKIDPFTEMDGLAFRRIATAHIVRFRTTRTRSAAHRVPETRRFRDVPSEERFSGLVCDRLTQALCIAFRRDVSDENGHCMDAAPNSGRK